MNIVDCLTIILILAVMSFVSYRAAKKSVTADDYLTAGRSLGKIQAGFSMAAKETDYS